MNKKSVNKKISSLEDLKFSMNSKQAFEAYIEDVDEMYNLHCIFADDIKGIIPREEVSCVVSENDGLVDSSFCLKKKGKIMQVCIKEIQTDDENNIKNVILSRKELELKVRRWMYMNLKPGMKLKGVVRGITDYAAFVDVGGGVTGLLKLEDISYVRVQKVSDKLKLGQRLQCVVKKYDKDTGKIELSLKDAQGDFKTRVGKLKEKDIVDGIVRSKTKTGMFIELPNNLVAMSEHVSGIEYGQKVLVYIKKINLEKEKIKVEIIG